MPAPEEIDLQLRAQQGDPPSIWALNEIAHLVDKANEVVRENWQLRSAKGGEVDDHNSIRP